ncbi:MAG TPA: hypothetical protein VHT91_25475 [Kofleriaceae bacterium]|nr:hypothetical protein [Kofleriaceae bacterium]
MTVRVECATDGLDAGVVLEVRPPDSPRRYRYALDWRAQPRDARPRLIGLAVAEAVDASRIELTAVPEPPPPGHPTAAARPAAIASDWSIALTGARRAFSGRTGVDLLGVGLAPVRRLSAHLALSADLAAEATTVLTSSGTVAVLSVSSAPRIAIRSAGRLHGELGVGARIGVVRMHGDALPGSQLAGTSQVRPWLGPAVDLAVGLEVTPRASLRAGLELGVVVTGVTARDLGEPVAAISGAWTSLGVAAVIEL